MNPARTFRRLGVILAGLAAAVTYLAAAVPAAQATPRPRPPGWNKRPPLPAHVHPLATSAIPGWQLALMALTVVLLVAVLVAIAYPGPGRPAAGERPYRLSDDHLPRHADPRGQPAALARPTPPRGNHRAGPRP